MSININKNTFYDDLYQITNLHIFESFIKAKSIINRPDFRNIACSISGGSDSDIMLDIISKVDFDKKVKYIWFDTGLEYKATKEHLKYLEQKYNITIYTQKAKTPIPISNKKYGQPFLSKQVSEWISRLQKYNFKWEDKPFEVLLKEYPKCKAALRWWCNDWDKKKNGSESSYNIAYNKYLKEFMIENPPQFNISQLCCKGAKKEPARLYAETHNIDLMIVGIRRSEGGARATAYKNCFTEMPSDISYYRPLFYYTNEDKELYKKLFDIEYSKCYEEYGLPRTGCAGCPFGRDFFNELKVIKTYEPKLYTAVNNIFNDSYSYTKAYKEFCNSKRKQSREG